MKLLFSIVGMTLAFTTVVYVVLSFADSRRPAPRASLAMSSAVRCTNPVVASRSALVGTYSADEHTLELRSDGRYSHRWWTLSGGCNGVGGYMPLESFEHEREGAWMPSAFELVLSDGRRLTVVEQAGALTLCEAGTRLWARR